MIIALSPIVIKEVALKMPRCVSATFCAGSCSHLVSTFPGDHLRRRLDDRKPRLIHVDNAARCELNSIIDLFQKIVESVDSRLVEAPDYI